MKFQRSLKFRWQIDQMSKLTLNVDYYLEHGKLVYTQQYHKKRGYCCNSGSGCRHCPYGKGLGLPDPSQIKKN